ncbi:hypothetical protein Sulku_1190 [Sulfuricurvum kujiense DSM 16994]|uniref:BioF2-like acetyltransferase domain-containing protein n=1 Tax=Sulfuricurvum kujiense (strain ATCC BAA-921 / DSM 16994 / JCM 11577 / YK-1) TaxID=709032 RepID=E4TX12_SULKY|nr:hypothetical protein [Sulfuricurvum kujiense]ADR33853.1 hypothetical protein Sulku_1190 [Sulfuricurvum kujiense DSM 16994]
MNSDVNKQIKQIPYISLDDLSESELVKRYIYPNLDINYYWSDDFSPRFYIALARAGFICVSHDIDNTLFLLPEMQTEYAVLDFSDLHISKKVRKLLNQERYKLSFNTCFSHVINSIKDAYHPCWITKEYEGLMHELSDNTYENFRLFSTELFDKENGELIAGEVGYITDNIYTSLSGFHIHNKRYDNWGTLQLVLLGKYLEAQKVRFWNLGHAQMEYKKVLGAKVLSREAFLRKTCLLT